MTLLNTSLLVMTAIFSLTASAQDIPNRPKWSGSFVRLSANEYLVAEDHPSLDAELSDVMTLEFWIRLDDPLPLPYQQATLFFKPNSWAIVIRPSHDVWLRQQDFPLIGLNTQLAFIPHVQAAPEIDYFSAPSFGSVALGVWQHFHLLFRFSQNRGRGWSISSRGHQNLSVILGDFPRWMNDSDAPLHIGNVPATLLDELGEWEFPYSPFGRVSISLDEVALTHGFAPQEREEAPVPDENTSALWRFSEGLHSATYRDSTANANHLRRGNALSVSPRGTATRTWAALKHPK